MPIKFTQSLTELLKVGWREASKYAAILGLTPTETAEFEAYIKLWDQLRICCGVQMSTSYRQYLQNETVSHKMRGGLIHDQSGFCRKLDLDAVEAAMMATQVFQSGAHIKEISHPTPREDAFTGSYCSRANQIIAEHHLSAHEKLQPHLSHDGPKRQRKPSLSVSKWL